MTYSNGDRKWKLDYFLALDYYYNGQRDKYLCKDIINEKQIITRGKIRLQMIYDEPKWITNSWKDESNFKC